MGDFWLAAGHLRLLLRQPGALQVLAEDHILSATVCADYAVFGVVLHLQAGEETDDERPRQRRNFKSKQQIPLSVNYFNNEQKLTKITCL